MFLVFPMDHLWLEHCCQPNAQGWSGWKVKEGRNTQTVSQEKVPPTSTASHSHSLSLPLSSASPTPLGQEDPCVKEEKEAVTWMKAGALTSFIH